MDGRKRDGQKNDNRGILMRGQARKEEVLRGT